jgi:phenylalanyl-tRNA synthetase beta chain
MEKAVREKLLQEGLQECITCDLISPALAELTQERQDKKSLISVLHPASIDQSVLRTSLLPGLLQMIKFNYDRMNKNVSAFEIGKIHFKEQEKYQEQAMVALICTGLSRPYHWETKPKEVDFYDLKGKVENLLLSFGIEEASFEAAHLHNFHPGRQARIKVGAIYVGAMGEVHPLHTAALGISARVLFCELNLHDLLLLRKKREKLEELSPYPGSERDWTLSVKEELAAGQILRWIREIPSPVLEKALLLDIYHASKEKKNITFRLFYRDKEKTISQERVESEHAKITQEVAKKAQDSLV